MENILDDNFNIEVKDETKINKRTSLLRYIALGYMASTSIKDIYQNYNLSALFNEETMGFDIITFAIMLFFVIWFFYHNIKHARLEHKSKYVISNISKPVIVCFIFFNSIMAFTFLSRSIQYLFNVRPEINTISLVILSLILLFISYREFVYLRRNKAE